MSDAEAVLFCEAAFNGDLDGVRALLENSPALANATNIRGQTALLCAATSGQYTIVLYLISHPTVNVNVIDSGSTPLHGARASSLCLLVLPPRERRFLSPQHGALAIVPSHPCH